MKCNSHGCCKLRINPAARIMSHVSFDGETQNIADRQFPDISTLNISTTWMTWGVYGSPPIALAGEPRNLARKLLVDHGHARRERFCHCSEKTFLRQAPVARNQEI